MSAPAPVDHFWWLTSRASGLVALGLMTLSVLLGLAMATRLLRAPGLSKALNGLHEHLSVASLLAIGLHGVTLLGDPWLRPGVAGIMLPFAIDYRPVWVAAGIVGGYAAAALGLSYYARRRIGSSRWRSAHRFVIVAWALSVVHTLGAGTDAALAPVRISLLGSVVLVAALLTLRILSRQPKPRRAAAATAAPRAAGSGAARGAEAG